MFHVFFRDDELVRLFGDRYKFKAQSIRRRLDAERGVRQAGVDAVRRLHVGRADLRITFDLLRRNPLLFEQVVEEHPRAGPRLPVGKDDVLDAEVMEAVYPPRIPLLDDDALCPVKDEDAAPFLPLGEAFDKGVVVAAGIFVQQMRRG